MKPAEHRLRERFPALLEALQGSPAMRPFAHDLRVLLDPYTKAQRITAAVQQHIGALTHLSSRDITSALERRLARFLEQTSLEAPPSLPAIRSRVRALLNPNEISPSELSRSTFGLVHATTTST